MKRSFLPVSADSHFPIQNLPLGVFSREQSEPHIGAAIGEYVLDLTVAQQRGLFGGAHFQTATLNACMRAGRSEWRKMRARMQELLDEECPVIRDNNHLRHELLIPFSQVQMHMPVSIGNYTDFYSSKEHATNVGAMVRDPKNPLLPNWLHVPIAYHGRASSVVVSGTPIRRPCGQFKREGSELPSFGPCRFLDFELEVGCLIGAENQLGVPIPVNRAHEHIFGLVLVNDWSARDIQSWEYQPLGPFLAKSFATSISPWVVMMDALEEFRVAGPAQDPPPLPYLQTTEPWGLNIDLEVRLASDDSSEETTVTTGNFRTLYWNICQQIAHHTSNGCPLKVGDLIASGTVSGGEPSSYGSLLELTWRGARPLTLTTGEERSSLVDGDTVTMTGMARGDGYNVGFGSVAGKVLPAVVDEELIVER